MPSYEPLGLGAHAKQSVCKVSNRILHAGHNGLPAFGGWFVLPEDMVSSLEGDSPLRLFCLAKHGPAGCCAEPPVCLRVGFHFRQQKEVCLLQQFSVQSLLHLSLIIKRRSQ
jgi:hypothetical protein